MMIEQILKDCDNAHQLRFVALRYFNVTGSIEGVGLQQAGNSYVIQLLLQSAHSGAPFHIFGTDLPTPDGTFIRDYVHVRDIADAHHRALLYLQKGNQSEILNIGTGHGWSIKQLVAAVQEITHQKIKIIIEQQRSGDPIALIADATKAAIVLGWQPQYSNLDYCLQTMKEG